MIYVGLGNPGVKYEHNRHNIGHLFIDWYRQQATPHPEWRTDSQSRVSYSQLPDQTTLLKPLSYMNESGGSVNGYLTKMGGTKDDLIVVHDDLDLAIGDFKISFGRGPQLHGGINSMETHLNSKDFWRIRIGVDHRDPDHRIPGIEYVLGDFTPEERAVVTAIFPHILTHLKERSPQMAHRS